MSTPPPRIKQARGTVHFVGAGALSIVPHVPSVCRCLRTVLDPGLASLPVGDTIITTPNTGARRLFFLSTIPSPPYVMSMVCCVLNGKNLSIYPDQKRILVVFLHVCVNTGGGTLEMARHAHGLQRGEEATSQGLAGGTAARTTSRKRASPTKPNKRRTPDLVFCYYLLEYTRAIQMQARRRQWSLYARTE